MPEKTTEPGRKPARKPKPEVVEQIPLSDLHPFPDHPFQVRDDDAMQETAESIKTYGVLVPALARPREDGGYELTENRIVYSCRTTAKEKRRRTAAILTRLYETAALIFRAAASFLCASSKERKWRLEWNTRKKQYVYILDQDATL